ncbi:MAG: T9SS type A sorting domain-containing protein [bacterium]|nr:T9SS type A sorting domain-containing protein [bacterium]
MAQRHSLRILILALAALAADPAASAWVSPGGEAPGPARITATPLAGDRVRVVVALPGFLREDVAVAGQGYVRLAVPGAPVLLETGAPELPFLPVNLVLPPVGDPVITVMAEIWRELPTLPPVPSRGNILRDRDPADVPLDPGPAYEVGGVLPAAAVTVGRPYLVRGRRGVGLRVFPLRWDADREVLLVLERLELEVAATGAGGANSRPGRVPPEQTGFTEAWPRRFANASPDKYRSLPTGGRLLLVCADAFVDGVQDFAQWKRERGLEVEVATVADLGGTAEAIAAAVAARYYAPESLGYVILVGDAGDVPTFAGLYEGADDDTRYSLVDGDDLYPDLFVSRVSARDDDELTTQLGKFIRYERDPDPAGDWYAHGAGIASILGDPTDAARADLLRADLLGFTYESVDRLYEPAATAAAIDAALEEGRSLVNYLGHGSGTSWSNPAFDLDDIAGLANGQRWPLIVDVSCANGRFTRDECFAEAWLRAGTPDTPLGAVAMYSSSTTTPWVPPTLMQEEAVDLLSGGQTWEIGAICLQGMMKVVDAYPGDIGRQLMEQYNVFGDCSLQLRTARPTPVTVEHAGALAVGIPFLPVATDVAGATVTLTAPGVLLGRAVTDADGEARLELAAPPTEPGVLVLTVTGPNLLTHSETIPVQVPITATLDRTALPVGETGELRVTLAEATDFAGDVVVSVSGHGVVDTERTIGPAGTALFELAPAYGESLVVSGRTADGSWDLFRRVLPVTGASPLPAPGLAAGAPSVGLTDALAPGTPGIVRGWSGATGIALSLSGCGVDTVVHTTGDTAVVTVIPACAGRLTAAVLVPGHTVHAVQVPVAPAIGTVGGQVTEAGTGLGVNGAQVQVWRAGEAPVTETVTDPLGRWFHEADLPAGPYMVRISAYGFADSTAVRTLLHGANGWDTALHPSPRVAVTGSVTAAGTGAALAAVLDVHRRPDGMLVATVRAAADGSYTTGPLPEGVFDVVLTCAGYVPRTLAMTVDTSGSTRLDTLEPLAGRILVIADNLPPGVPHAYPAKLDKRGELDHYGYSIVPTQSGLTAIQDLFALGYDATFTPWSANPGSDWSAYDAVVVACGDNPAPLGDGLADAVAGHLAAGGHLLLEGGEVAAAYADDGIFMRDVLHVGRWTGDVADSVDLTPAVHALAAGPARIFFPATYVPVGYAAGDRVVPAADAAVAASWSSAGAAVVTFDDDGDTTGGQIVYAALDYSRLDPGPRHRLLQNALEYLLRRVPADGSVAGRVHLDDPAPGAVVEISLAPGGRRTTASADGPFLFSGLAAGSYRALVEAPGYAAVARRVVVPPAGSADLGDLALQPVAEAVAVDSAATVVPDDDPIGLTRILPVVVAGAVSDVRLVLAVEHPWEDDLVIDLTCPDGTTARLRHGGAGAGPVSGAYARSGHPVLADFIGRDSGGTWLLRIIDTELLDEGTLVSWRLEVTHAVDPELPPPVALRVLGNRPNPFNPATSIVFAVPAAGPVEIDIHDLRGRRVKRLPYRAETAGEHAVLFTGRDERGRSLASGVYLVRIRAGGEQDTAKILLVR